MTKETLHLFRDDGGNVYAARDLAHAKALWSADTGEDPDAFGWGTEWQSIPDDREITIRDDDEPSPVTKTAGEWASEAFEPCCIGGDNY